ncbi:MAG: exopolysaccharide biosynthesis protein exod [Rhodospirillaceae bacterium]|nr:exopolysaccharide biosynthesis protein exod [Rhodospirillaceae bacterium]
MAQQKAESLHEIADRTIDRTSGETVTVGEVIDASAGRAFGPLLLLPALVALAPLIGAIPGVSVVTGAIIAVIAVQALFGRKSPWLPKTLNDLSFKRQPLEEGMKRVRPVLEKIDTVLSPRLSFMAGGFGFRIAMLCAVLMAILMYPLALVPWGVMLPAAAVTIIGIGVTADDGAWILAGVVVSTAAAVAAYMLWTSAWAGLT